MFQRDPERAREAVTEAGGEAAAGKRARTERLQCRAALSAPVQLRAPQRGAQEGSDPFWFATGPAIADGGGALPHGETIQRAFGHHDVSGVQAHVGGAAAEGAKAMGAEAYATGHHVAFAQHPDLHTSAHEAAHVVQQRAGVQLLGGVGEVGDVYERHADEVADAVVRGESVAGLLDRAPGGGGCGGGVQRKYKRDQDVAKEEWDKPRFDDFFGGYIKVLGPEQDGRQLVEELASGKHWLFDFDKNEFVYALSVREDVDEEEDSSSSSDEEEDAPIELFHGTDLKTATLLASKKTKIKALGKGELGGGFYMTHDVHQAGHIADYYCTKENRGNQWAVVKFTVPRKLLVALAPKRKDVPPDEFEDYYQKVKQSGNDKQSKHPWTIGNIKDNTTPYMQHLFAQEGLDVLNDDGTARVIVLQGQTGVEKHKYQKGNATKKYDPDEDETFQEILGLGEDTEEDEDVDGHESKDEKSNEVDEDDETYDELVSEVGRAEKARAVKLTGKVMKEVQEAFDETGDKRYLELLERLQAIK